jgi:S1-C subfamily serine protease
MNVPANSKGAKAGFQTGDVLLKIVGKSVHSIQDLKRLIKQYSAKNVTVTVFNATERTVRLNLNN